MQEFKERIVKVIQAIDAVMDDICAIKHVDNESADSLDAVVETLNDARTSLETIVKLREPKGDGNDQH